MTVSFNDIGGSHNWDIIEPVNKGWSDDKKYHIITKEGRELLLRLSDISQYEKKKREFECLRPLMDMDILFTQPIDFGICNNGQSVYSLLTWIDGEDAEIILPKLDDKEQYMLGLKAGMYLKQIHSVPAPQSQPNWAERFNRKIERNIGNYNACSIHFQNDDKLIDYIEQNRSLLINRPQSFQHGDYHVGNMIITPKGELGIIDFNRMDYGDPWEEFNRITWCAEISPMFASGYINGYFDGNSPDLFFRLMALYIASNQLSSIPWSVPFGEEEVNTMLKQVQSVLKWYDDFSTYIPNWYLKLDKISL